MNVESEPMLARLRPLIEAFAALGPIERWIGAVAIVETQAKSLMIEGTADALPMFAAHLAVVVEQVVALARAPAGRA